MLDVLFEDNHLLIVNKPAGLATMGVSAAAPSLVTVAKQYLKQKYFKPGNVYLGIVSRLDRLVSGVVVLARTSKAAERLNRQFASSTVDKLYWAIVSPPPRPATACLAHQLYKDEARQRMRVVAGDVARRDVPTDAKPARLSYRTRRRHERLAWLEVQLETGRKHQIRVQLAHHGCPIVGDRKYGSPLPFPHGIALHARQLAIDHPVRNERLTIVARLPAAWGPLQQQFGLPDD